MDAIYLDYNATTPLDPEVLEKMRPYFESHFGNAASASHQWGWAADSAAQKARHQVASLIGAQDSEITFTAGTTESNNMVVFGLIRELRMQDRSAPIHFVTTNIEHPSITESLLFAQKYENIEVDFVPCDKNGIVSAAAIEKVVKPHTRLVSIIWVQNEIGAIQNLSEISQLTRDRKIYLHTDATQGIGKINFDVELMGVDLVSASAHKFYGPKGIGFLYKRARNPKVRLQPLMFGGGQENGLRSGTLNIASIVGLGAAAEKCERVMKIEQQHDLELRDLLWKLLSDAIPSIRLNGPPLEQRSHENLNITFPEQNFVNVLPLLPQLGVSAGSACHSGSWTYSRTLMAVGVTEDEARSTLRMSLGRGTTEAQIRSAAERLIKALKA